VLAELLSESSLPSRHRRALGLLRMGHVVKLSIRFRDAFWHELLPEDDPPKFLHAEGPFPVWWTGPGAAPSLVAWAGGPAASRLARLNQRELVVRAVRQLSAMLGLPPVDVASRLEETACRDWARDRCFRGAYAHARAGGADAAEILAEPVDGRLFLAGEAVSEAMGTVEGGWEAGVRAARQVLTAG
jgi:monoamine oxidase